MTDKFSEEAQLFMDKLFKCVSPCDSWGICDGCAERDIFVAGYTFGLMAFELAVTSKRKQSPTNEDK